MLQAVSEAEKECEDDVFCQNTGSDSGLWTRDTFPASPPPPRLL